ncbi:response regulator, partial [Dolichospermum sp. ST_sed3]|nr:response regulator [Dolichospermum sp. ST_sed3]
MNTKGTILVVDDTTILLAFLTTILNDEGFETISADSGELALVSLEKRMPDLILLDILMPGIDGFEVCRQIKSQEKLSHIPIIFLTALTEKEDRIKGLQLGAVDYIIKPFEEKELLIKVKNHITIRRLNLEVQKKSEELEENNLILKLANQKILDQHNQLQLIADSLPALIARIDTNLKYIFANKAYFIIFKKTPEQIIGKHLSQIIDKETF